MQRAWSVVHPCGAGLGALTPRPPAPTDRAEGVCAPSTCSRHSWWAAAYLELPGFVLKALEGVARAELDALALHRLRGSGTGMGASNMRGRGEGGAGRADALGTGPLQCQATAVKGGGWGLGELRAEGCGAALSRSSPPPC